MKSLGTYLGCGRYEARSKDKNTQVGDFVVTKLSDITEKIIPFFEKYPINGVKHLDYLDFCRVAELTLVPNSSPLGRVGDLAPSHRT
jgi:hypothetical protein